MTCVSFTFTLHLQGGRGHWADYYTSSQSFIITFGQHLWGHLMILNGWFMKLSVILFSIIGDVHQINSTMSYPFRSLLHLFVRLSVRLSVQSEVTQLSSDEH